MAEKYITITEPPLGHEQLLPEYAFYSHKGLSGLGVSRGLISRLSGIATERILPGQVYAVEGDPTGGGTLTSARIAIDPIIYSEE